MRKMLWKVSPSDDPIQTTIKKPSREREWERKGAGKWLLVCEFMCIVQQERCRTRLHNERFIILVRIEKNTLSVYAQWACECVCVLRNMNRINTVVLLWNSHGFNPLMCRKCGDYYCDTHLLAHSCTHTNEHRAKHHFIATDSIDPCECVSVLYSLVFSVLRNDMYQYRIPRIVDDTDIAITIAIAIAEPQYNLSKGKKHTAHRNKCH